MAPTLLLALLSPTQPRRPKVLFNCLQGRKTVSILFWSLRYDVLSWSNVLPNLTWAEMTNAIDELVKRQQVLVTPDGQLVVAKPAVPAWQTAVTTMTELVPETLRQQARWLPWQQVSETGLLGLQAVAQAQHHEMTYFPVSVTEQARAHVREWFKTLTVTKTVDQVPRQLHDWLLTLPDRQAQLFVSQLVGPAHPGTTTTQLSQLWSVPGWTIQLQQIANWLSLAVFLQSEATGLALLVAPFWQPMLAPSLDQTLTALKQGLTQTQIQQQRGLKVSTINEHLLEAAIWLPADEFPYKRLLTADVINQVRQQQPQNIDEWQYETQTAAADFFTFRLVQIWETKHDSGTNPRETE
ncbi:helix-turn-helix domain-containing protein [Furfurilactobacillus sp. WILCCON 0119]